MQLLLLTAIVTLAAGGCTDVSSMPAVEENSMTAVGWMCEVGGVACADDLSGVCHVVSSSMQGLVLSGSSYSGELVFPELVSIDASSGNAVEVTASNLVTALRLPKLATVNAPSTGSVTGVLITNNNELLEVELAALTTTGSAQQGFNVQANPKLTSFLLSSLETTADLRVLNCITLSQFEAPLLTQTAYISLGSSPLTVLRLDALQSLTGSATNQFGSNAPLDLVLPELETIVSTNIAVLFGGTGLRSVTCPKLTTITAGSLASLAVSSNTLKTLDFPALTSLVNQGIFFQSAAMLEIASFPSLSSIDGTVTLNSIGSGFVSLPALSSPTVFSATTNTGSATLDVRSLPSTGSSGAITVDTIIVAGSVGSCTPLTGPTVTATTTTCGVNYITSGDCGALPSLCIVENGGFACSSDPSFIYSCKDRSYIKECGGDEFLDGSFTPVTGGLCSVAGTVFQCDNDSGAFSGADLTCTLTTKRNPVWSLSSSGIFPQE